MSNKTTVNKLVLWCAFIMYVFIASITMLHHEMWGDELQAWNIAKASSSVFNLLHNMRYEGHPPLWHLMLWIISRFSHQLIYMQLLHLMIAVCVVFVVLFYAPFSTITKLLLPFGYYFVYEYAVLSRNYALGVLFAFLICIVLDKQFKHKLVVYYCLLFLMTNVHLIALFLAVSLHIYFLLKSWEEKKNTTFIAVHILLAALVFLPAAYIISPVNDGHVNNILQHKWGISGLSGIALAPLRAFIPMPAWWKYNFWNTQFLIELGVSHQFFKLILPFVSLSIIGCAYYILKDNRKCIAMFFSCLLLSFIGGIIYPKLLQEQRFVGILFIGFLTAYWLRSHQLTIKKNKIRLINIMLIGQLAAGLFIVYKDVNLPFSTWYKVNELLGKIPPEEAPVADYWVGNAILAFKDKPFYSVVAKRKLTFLSLGSDINTVAKPSEDKDLFYVSLIDFFKTQQLKVMYMLSCEPIDHLLKRSPKSFSIFKVQIINKIEGAVESESNLYLYKISII